MTPSITTGFAANFPTVTFWNDLLLHVYQNMTYRLSTYFTSTRFLIITIIFQNCLPKSLGASNLSAIPITGNQLYVNSIKTTVNHLITTSNYNLLK